MSARKTPVALLVALCALALAIGGFSRPGPAWAESVSAKAKPTKGEGGPSSAAPIHGLAPLPGDAPVPLVDRPPGSAKDDGGPSPVIFPPQQLTIRFNHKKHVKELGFTCTTCHEKAKTSKVSSDELVPKPTRCDGCHGSDHRNLNAVKTDEQELIGQCGFCHIGYKPGDGNRVARMVMPKPNLKMNHQIHLERNIGCGQCHGNVENIELATRDQLPRMRGCFGCHQQPTPTQGKAKGECVNCHLTERGGMMKIAFSAGTLKPPRWLHDSGHSADWIERHKQVAANDSQFCSNCHSEKYCADCHDGKVRSRKVHPNDWISMHPISARQDNPRCTSCHREQTFCIACHQRSGVTLSGPYANFAGRGRFHPPKAVWTDPPRSSGHHAWEAERNLNACVSCHVERDCAMCHATAARGGRGWQTSDGFGGQGTNPHPRNFQDRCKNALKRNARPCLVCHDPTDPALGKCR